MGRVPSLAARDALGGLGKLLGSLLQHDVPVRCAYGTFGQSRLPSDAGFQKFVSLLRDLECEASSSIADVRPVLGRVCRGRRPLCEYGTNAGPVPRKKCCSVLCDHVK
jgi:hypothetical protein